MEELDVADTAVTEKKPKATKSTKKPTAKRKTTTAKSTRTRKKATEINISDEQRLGMIAEAAYFKAEKRGFVGGSPEDDWLAAESEVDALLSANTGQQANA